MTVFDFPSVLIEYRLPVLMQIHIPKEEKKWQLQHYLMK